MLFVSHARRSKARSRHHCSSLLHAAQPPAGKPSSTPTTRGVQTSACQTKTESARQTVLDCRSAVLVQLEAVSRHRASGYRRSVAQSRIQALLARAIQGPPPTRWQATDLERGPGPDIQDGCRESDLGSTSDSR